jgi:WD40 repeat protein
LAAFDDDPVDALLFFGREREREIIVANLLASRLTVLYGPTGVGKSSLLRAGVAQELRSLPDATVGVFSSWSDDPSSELDAVVWRSAGDVFLILDQIEEYFLYHDQDGPFGQLLPDLVTSPGLRVNVLLGVREDALAKLDFFKGRIPNLFANYLRLDHLDRAAARAAVLGPLSRLSDMSAEGEPYRAEPALVDTLLDQVATGRIEYGLTGRGVVAGRDEPARIESAFLQLVLERLWEVERAEGSHVLRLQTLQSLGGAETIVRGHLERSLESLDPRQQELAAEIFEHLVTPSGTKIAHDVGDLARYATAHESAVDDVLVRLAHERIVRPLEESGDVGRYEIFHDVLADGVLAWRTKFESERELQRERARRRRAIAVAGVALLALAAVALVALFALAQRERAQERATTARARERAARALTLLAVDPQESLRLAIAAAGDERTPQVEEVLRRSLLAARQRRVFPASSGTHVVAFGAGGRVIVPLGGRIRSYAPNGRSWRDGAGLTGTLLALSHNRSLMLDAEGNRAVVRGTSTGRRVESFTLQGPVRSGTFDRRGRFVAVVSANRAGREYASVFRLRDGVRTHVFRQRGTKSVAFSPDGKLVATGHADDAARVWRLSDARLLRTFDEHTGDVLAVAFSPDSELLATASADSGVRIWRLTDGERRFLFVGHNNPAVALAWSPDGRFLADASSDRTSRILDIGGVGAGRMAAVLIGHREAISALTYSPDGRTIATVSRDGTARLWDARAESEALRAATHRPGPTRAWFDPTGTRAVSAGIDGASVIDVERRRVAARIDIGRVASAHFDPSGTRIVVAGPWGASIHDVHGRLLAELPHRGGVNDAAFSADGREVVTASQDGWVRIFGQFGGLLGHLELEQPITHIAVARDGLIAAAGGDGTIVLWRRGGRSIVLTGHEGRVNAVHFSGDGTRIVSAGDDGVVRVWTETGALEFALSEHVGGATDAVFSPGGTAIVTTDRARHVREWSATDGRLIRDLVGHFASVNSAAYSRDGRWIVTTSAVAAAVWKANDNAPSAYLRGHTAPVVRTAEFSPDGRFVLTAADDGTARLYRCEFCENIEGLVALARQRLEAVTTVR